MGYFSEKAIFTPLEKEILEESSEFSCDNEDLDDFFHNDSIAYANDLFGKNYCFCWKEEKKETSKSDHKSTDISIDTKIWVIGQNLNCMI